MRETGFGRALVFLVFFMCGCAALAPDNVAHGGTIRVMVLKGAPSLAVKNDAGSQEYRITRTGPGRAEVNGSARALPFRFYPGRNGGHVYINGRPYAGTIEIFDGKSGLVAVNELYLETYLVGIINNEISTRWPPDVVKSQAVVARTYAIYQKQKRRKEPYDLEGSVMGQVYNGVAAEDRVALRAVRETAGEILTYGGEPALTVYHSNAGGMTESAGDVWSSGYPYLKSVKSPYDETAPRFAWEAAFQSARLKKILNDAGHGIGEPEEIYVDSVTGSGRVRSLVIRDASNRRVRLSGEDLRKAAGYGVIKSTMFRVVKDADMFVFKGKGSGHGVGLSQWGARGMAEKGYSYREILSHYYPGTRLSKAY